jgi:hypothetical protein
MARQRFRNNHWVMTGHFLETTSGPGKCKKDLTTLVLLQLKLEHGIINIGIAYV